MFIFAVGMAPSLMAKPDTVTNRYATKADAGHWPSVNQGDYIFFQGNNDNGDDIYAAGEIVRSPANTGHRASQGEGDEVKPTVIVVMENCFILIAPRHHVAIGTGKFKSQAPWHAERAGER